MRAILNGYRFLNTLSVDVALGAVVSCLFLCSAFGVSVSWQTVLCLGLVVWLIYTVDHLLDAKRMKTGATTPRHQFHSINFKIMSWLTVVGAAVAAFLLLAIETEILIVGVVLATLVMIYFLLLKRLSVAKEIFGAVLYFSGVMIPVIATPPGADFLAMPGAMFFLLVLINLVLFSWFDLDADAEHDHKTVATQLGGKNTRMLLGVLYAITGLFLMAGFFAEMGQRLWFTYTVMYLLLLVVFLFPEWHKRDERYRVVGDFVFFVPLAYLIF
ncbi:MAG: UbiA family prenyltransferase [Cyclobacteriaceae bacterium]